MNNPLSYILMILSAIITAFSQILLKKSTGKKYEKFIFEYINPHVVFSYTCYLVVLALNVFIYTKTDYRFAVVINSLSYVFVMILSKVLLKEKIAGRNILGNILIITGILFFTLY